MPTYLIICSTGRQGSSVVKALSAKGETSIVVSSRNPSSAATKRVLAIDGVTKAVKAELGDPDSLLKAIQESGADRLWFNTDFFNIPAKIRTRETEAQYGYNVIDASKKAGTIKHLVFNSVSGAGSMPDNLTNFEGKYDIEQYLAKEFDSASGLTWAVVRPLSYFENVDDAANQNPLTKGYAKLLIKPDAPVEYISCTDIGKAAGTFLMDPEKYNGRVLEAAGAKCTGVEIAKVLSEVSGVECKYKMAVPRPLLWLISRELYHLVRSIEANPEGAADINELKEIVPDAMDAKAFFESKGKWANGESFGSEEKSNESSVQWKAHLFRALVLSAGYYAYLQYKGRNRSN